MNSESRIGNSIEEDLLPSPLLLLLSLSDIGAILSKLFLKFDIGPLATREVSILFCKERKPFRGSGKIGEGCFG